MIGEVQSQTLKGGLAVLSTCDGLVSTEVPHSQKNSRSCEKSFFFYCESNGKSPPDSSRVKISLCRSDAAVDELTVNFPWIPAVWELLGLCLLVFVSKFPKTVILVSHLSSSI